MGHFYTFCVMDAILACNNCTIFSHSNNEIFGTADMESRSYNGNIIIVDTVFNPDFMPGQYAGLFIFTKDLQPFACIHAPLSVQ